MKGGDGEQHRVPRPRHAVRRGGLRRLELPGGSAKPGPVVAVTHDKRSTIGLIRSLSKARKV